MNERDSEPDHSRRLSDITEISDLLNQETIDSRVISNVLEIRNIKKDLEEFKTDTKGRMIRIENWMVSSLSVGFTTLITVLGMILFK